MRPYLYTYVCHIHLPVIAADIQFSTILLADLILTGMIAYGLWRSKTGWKDTDAMIKRIIMYACSFQSSGRKLTCYSFSCEAQLMPTIMALGMLIQYATSYNSFINFFFMYVLFNSYKCCADE
jgi:hypothetical protein